MRQCILQKNKETLTRLMETDFGFFSCRDASMYPAKNKEILTRLIS